MTKRSNVPPPDRDSERIKPQAESWRIFLAISLPENVRDLIRRLQKIDTVAGLPLRFVDPGIAHITLHFLGNTPPESAELLSLSLSATLGQLSSFSLRTGHMGVFPDERKPRVLWLGLAGQTDKLTAVHRSLGHSLRSLGFPVENGPLRPHITLGRVRDGSWPSLAADVRRALGDAEVSKALEPPEAFAVNEILLIRSHLEKHGPRYETLRSVRLCVQ